MSDGAALFLGIVLSGILLLIAAQVARVADALERDLRYRAQRDRDAFVGKPPQPPIDR